MPLLKKRGTTAPLWRNVSPDQRDNLFRLIEYMAEYGFHRRLIADTAGITESQVYLALQKLRIRLRDYRDGKTMAARRVIAVAPPVARVKFRKAN